MSCGIGRTFAARPPRATDPPSGSVIASLSVVEPALAPLILLGGRYGLSRPVEGGGAAQGDESAVSRAKFASPPNASWSAARRWAGDSVPDQASSSQRCLKMSSIDAIDPGKRDEGDWHGQNRPHSTNTTAAIDRRNRQMYSMSVSSGRSSHEPKLRA